MMGIVNVDILFRTKLFICAHLSSLYIPLAHLYSCNFEVINGLRDEFTQLPLF